MSVNVSHSQDIFGFTVEGSGYADGSISVSNRDDWGDGKIEVDLTIGGEISVSTPTIFGESASASASGEISHSSSATITDGIESGLTPTIDSDLITTLKSSIEGDN